MKGSTLRKIFLILFLVAYAGACFGAWMMGQKIFFCSLLWCGLGIGGAEIVSVILTGKTLSTNITVTWKEGNWKSFWGYFMSACLVLLMLFLGLHFFPWEWIVG